MFAASSTAAAVLDVYDVLVLIVNTLLQCEAVTPPLKVETHS